MTDERSTGLILRTRPLTESSLIVHWLTPELGRIATVAKGARRPKSPFAGKLDLLFFADFSFRRSRSGDLHLLREVAVRNFNTKLREDLHRLQQAAYFAMLLEQCSETETPIPELFELMVAAVQMLAQTPPRSATVFAFEIQLLAALGLKPIFESTALSSGAREALMQLAATRWPDVQAVALTPSQQREANRFLRHFLEHHLGRIPRGRDPALGISSTGEDVHK